MSKRRIRNTKGEVVQEFFGNELDRFRSYTYRHVFFTTAFTSNAPLLLSSVEKLAAVNDLKTKRALDKIETVKDSKNPFDYGYILANSFCDSQYVIDTVMYTVMTQTMSSTIGFASQGSITIKESFTANFLGDLVNIGRELGVLPYELCYVLKTYIIGITHEGKEDVIELNPVIFWLENIVASFNDNGGAYDMSFCSASDLPNVKSFGNIQLPKATVAEDGTFKSAIAHLEKSVNDGYDKEYEAAIKLNPASPPRKSKCIITFPDEWGQFKVDTPNPKNYTETNKNETTKPKPEGSQLIIHGRDTPIKNMLSNILMMVPQVKQYADKNTNDKIAFTISIDTHSILDKDTVYFYYHIYPYPTYKGFKESEMFGRRECLLEFDYLFSGKNEDILSFDMKIEDAKILLGAQPKNIKESEKDKEQSVVAAPNKKTDKVNTEIDNNAESGDVQETNALTPLSSIPASTLRRGSFNISPEWQAIDNAYKANLAAFSASGARLSLQIRGNPLFVNVKAKTNYKQDNTKEKYDEYIKKRYAILEQNILSSTAPNDDMSDSDFEIIQSIIPINIRLNVYTPKYSDMRRSDNYVQPFYYTGHYLIWEIGTSFANGEFTQTLTAQRMQLASDLANIYKK